MVAINIDCFVKDIIITRVVYYPLINIKNIIRVDKLNVIGLKVATSVLIAGRELIIIEEIFR